MFVDLDTSYKRIWIFVCCISTRDVTLTKLQSLNCNIIFMHTMLSLVISLIRFSIILMIFVLIVNEFEIFLFQKYLHIFACISA